MTLYVIRVVIFIQKVAKCVTCPPAFPKHKGLKWAGDVCVLALSVLVSNHGESLCATMTCHGLILHFLSNRYHVLLKNSNSQQNAGEGMAKSKNQ